MSQSIHFFATKNDLLAILQGVEEKTPLQYVRSGRFASALPEIFFRSDEILDLGVARSGSSVSCDSYLIGFEGLEIQSRHLSGARPFAFDQLLNPKTVSLTPGGVWGQDILIRGMVGTATKNSISLQILKLLNAAFKKKAPM